MPTSPCPSCGWTTDKPIRPWAAPWLHILKLRDAGGAPTYASILDTAESALDEAALSRLLRDGKTVQNPAEFRRICEAVGVDATAAMAGKYLPLGAPTR